MYKYNLSWITKDGRRVENQLFTAEHISHKLAELEQAESSSIRLESIDPIKPCTISSIDVDDDTIDVWFLTSGDDFEDHIVLEKSECEFCSPNENFEDLLESIEEKTNAYLGDADKIYLEENLMPTIEKWSIQDKWLYC